MRQRQPKKAEENGLAKEAAEADAAKKAEEECAAREAAELAARLRGASGKRRSSTSNQDGQEQRPALKLRRKLKRNV